MSDVRAWLLLALVGGCAEPPIEPPEERLADVDGAVDGPGVPLQALVDAGRQPATARPPVLDRVSDPTRITEAAVRNRHEPDQIDTLTTWHYDGLSFTVYRSTATGRERMQRVEVTSEDHRTADGVRVGMTREAVIGIRGQPAAVGVDADIYRLRGPLPGQLRIGYDDDQVVMRLTWIFPID